MWMKPRIDVTQYLKAPSGSQSARSHLSIGELIDEDDETGTPPPPGRRKSIERDTRLEKPNLKLSNTSITSRASEENLRLRTQLKKATDEVETLKVKLIKEEENQNELCLTKIQLTENQAELKRNYLKLKELKTKKDEYKEKLKISNLLQQEMDYIKPQIDQFIAESKNFFDSNRVDSEVMNQVLQQISLFENKISLLDKQFISSIQQIQSLEKILQENQNKHSSHLESIKSLTNDKQSVLENLIRGKQFADDNWFTEVKQLPLLLKQQLTDMIHQIDSDRQNVIHDYKSYVISENNKIVEIGRNIENSFDKLNTYLVKMSEVQSNQYHTLQDYLKQLMETHSKNEHNGKMLSTMFNNQQKNVSASVSQIVNSIEDLKKLTEEHSNRINNINDRINTNQTDTVTEKLNPTIKQLEKNVSLLSEQIQKVYEKTLSVESHSESLFKTELSHKSITEFRHEYKTEKYSSNRNIIMIFLFLFLMIITSINGYFTYALTQEMGLLRKYSELNEEVSEKFEHTITEIRNTIRLYETLEKPLRSNQQTLPLHAENVEIISSPIIKPPSEDITNLPINMVVLEEQIDESTSNTLSENINPDISNNVPIENDYPEHHIEVNEVLQPSTNKEEIESTDFSDNSDAPIDKDMLEIREDIEAPTIVESDISAIENKDETSLEYISSSNTDEIKEPIQIKNFEDSENSFAGPIKEVPDIIKDVNNESNSIIKTTSTPSPSPPLGSEKVVNKESSQNSVILKSDEELYSFWLYPFYYVVDVVYNLLKFLHK